MSATGFTTDWLEERYRFDSAARSRELTNLFMQHLGSKTTYHLLDLGAGIGSNVKYFSDKIKADQFWYLLEIDQHLIDYGKLSIQKFLAKNNYEVQDDGAQLVAKKNHTIHVSYIRDSIFNIKPTQYLAFDGILGNALLDVFTLEQLQQLMDQMKGALAPKLFSIVYQNMEWQDEAIDNEFFVEKYHNHMRRRQSEGPALGPDSIHTIKTHISVSQDMLLFQDSHWEVKPTDQALLKHLLRFYEMSIPETSNDPGFIARFRKWYAQKTNHLGKELLSAIVFHQDLLWVKKDY